MMLVDQDSASQSCYTLEMCKKSSWISGWSWFEVSVALGWTGEKKPMLRQISLTFEEHLVSLSLANCAVNTSLTTSRAHFHQHNIWLGGVIAPRGEGSGVAGRLCCLCRALSRRGRASRDAAVNAAQMLYLRGAQEPGPTLSEPSSLSWSLPLSLPACASGVTPRPRQQIALPKMLKFVLFGPLTAFQQTSENKVMGLLWQLGFFKHKTLVGILPLITRPFYVAANKAYGLRRSCMVSRLFCSDCYFLCLSLHIF